MSLDHGRIASRHAVVGNVFRDDTSSGDDAACPDGDTRTNGHIATDPRIVADGYRMSRFHRVPALQVILRVLWRVEAAVGSDEHMVANGDETLIEHRTVVVDAHVFADGDAAAVVAMEGRHQLRGLGKTRNEVFYHLPVVVVVHSHSLQSSTQATGVLPTGFHLRSGVIVQQSTPHLFKFCHFFYISIND